LRILTGDLGGGVEDGGDLRVELDDIAALADDLADDLAVALLDLIKDPLGELGLQHGGAHVADPLLRGLVDLLVIRKVSVDLLVPAVQELADLLDGEALVLRHRDVPDVLVLDDLKKKTKMRKRLSRHHGVMMALTLLLPGHDVLKEVDRDLVVVGHVEAAVDGDEVVDLTLRLVLRGELLRGYFGAWWPLERLIRILLCLHFAICIFYN